MVCADGNRVVLEGCLCAATAGCWPLFGVAAFGGVAELCAGEDCCPCGVPAFDPVRWFDPFCASITGPALTQAHTRLRTPIHPRRFVMEIPQATAGFHLRRMVT